MKNVADEFYPHQAHSTSTTFGATKGMQAIFESVTTRRAIGRDLKAEYLYFKKEIATDVEGGSQLESNLLPVMPWIVSAKAPLLEAAKTNTQIEFDRTFRTIVKEKGYQGKRVVFISGLHIDISPLPGQVFPLTKFIPWAAFVQRADGSQESIEQQALYELLKAQSDDNIDQVDLEDIINVMEHVEEVKVV